MYVTHYFRRIDARRHKAEQHKILPLKKVERAILVDPYSVLPATQERKKLVSAPGIILLIIPKQKTVYDSGAFKEFILSCGIYVFGIFHDYHQCDSTFCVKFPD
jgi:hypothetical protein